MAQRGNPAGLGPCPGPNSVFCDGFESGGTAAWTLASQGRDVSDYIWRGDKLLGAAYVTGGGIGHVAYDTETLVLAVAGAGALAAGKVEAATGSELIGGATGLVIDFFNPAQDIVAIESLLEDIGTDIIESSFGVDLDDETQTATEPDCKDHGDDCPEAGRNRPE